MTFKPANKSLEEFEDYESFIKKFEIKKTTDDCYTPKSVYDAVLDWVKDEIGIEENLEIIRPFYPGGNYENEDYTGKIVIDNPPFSIYSKIIKFYQEKSVKFFLFAPRITCLSGTAAGMENLTAIFAGGNITYENGASIPTAFVTNMAGDLKIWCSETLAEKIKKSQIEKSKKKINKYIYPERIIKSSDLEQYGNLKIHRKHTLPIAALDDQKKQGKSIYGKGLLLTAEAAKAAKAAKTAKTAKTTIWELSLREKELLAQLDQDAANINHDGTPK